MLQHNVTANPVRTRSPVKRKRAEQQRSQDTRSAILDAALAEFASKSFDAASIRSIAERIGVQHPLITYHFRSKEILWRAVAEYVFERVRTERAPHFSDPDLAPAGEHRRFSYSPPFPFHLQFPPFILFTL